MTKMSWRPIDIVIGAVLGVTCGIIFIVWNIFGGAGYKVFDALTPGLGGLVTGIWIMAGVLGGLVIRKPGAALYVELLAAMVSVIGSQWGYLALLSGLAQGAGAGLIFLLFGYKKWTLPVAMLAGASANAAEWALELITSGNLAMSLGYNLIYLGSMLISGAILGGVVAWLFLGVLVKAGALERFAAGRENRELI